MTDRALEVVRRKLVGLMRVDPPFRLVPPSERGTPPSLDRWIASRLTAEEVRVLFRLEHEYGEAAMAEWLAEALLEAGLVVPARRLAS
jgi:uncharacterized protein (DUF2236 family)